MEDDDSTNVIEFKGLHKSLKDLSSNTESYNVYCIPKPIQHYQGIIANNQALHKKRFFFCRHAETEYNKRGVIQGSGIDARLNQKGKEQAESLMEYFNRCNAKFDRVLCSDLKRAQETAKIVCGNSLPVDININYREISWGVLEGTDIRTSEDLKNLLLQWNNYRNFDAKAERGESPNDVIKRAIPDIYKLVKEEPHIKTNLIVSHGRTLRIILSYLLTSGLESMSQFQHKNTCVNVLDAYYDPNFDEIQWIPLVLNDHSHLNKDLL